MDALAMLRCNTIDHIAQCFRHLCVYMCVCVNTCVYMHKYICVFVYIYDIYYVYIMHMHIGPFFCLHSTKSLCCAAIQSITSYVTATTCIHIRMCS